MRKSELVIQIQEDILLHEIRELFSKIRRRSSTVPNQLLAQVNALFELRSEIYEDLNQLQHKSLIIAAAKYIQSEMPSIDRWTWHPKQTSSQDDGDLTGYVKSKVIVNAEVTTSKRPVGTIGERMQRTLTSLSNKKGRKFYFVQTDEMLKRANYKIRTNGWSIRCIKLINDI